MGGHAAGWSIGSLKRWLNKARKGQAVLRNGRPLLVDGPNAAMMVVQVAKAVRKENSLKISEVETQLFEDARRQTALDRGRSDIFTTPISSTSRWRLRQQVCDPLPIPRCAPHCPRAAPHAVPHAVPHAMLASPIGSGLCIIHRCSIC